MEATTEQYKVLNDVVKDVYTNPKAKELIKSIEFLLWFEYENKSLRTCKEAVEALKIYYSKLGLNELLMLWYDNYNSMMIIKRSEPDNRCSFLVRNKVLALSTLINKLL